MKKFIRNYSKILTLIIIIILLHNIQPISNKNDYLLSSLSSPSSLSSFDSCSIDNYLNLNQNKDWFMMRYHQRRLNQDYSINLQEHCLAETMNHYDDQESASTIIVSNKYRRWRLINSLKLSIKKWSKANDELLQAITKVILLVLIKIFIKYYILCNYLNTFLNNINDMKWQKFVKNLIDLISKSSTIAITKYLIKHSPYSAIRTAMKTMFIVLIKQWIKPFLKSLKKLKSSDNDLNDNVIVIEKYLKIFTYFFLSIQIKTIIKTIALHLLWLIFDKNENSSNLSLLSLMLRIELIILVKYFAKRSCKTFMGGGNKRKVIKSLETMNETIIDNDTKQSISSSTSTSSPPVDQISLFAIQKLVTKLIKIPLIRILY